MVEAACRLHADTDWHRRPEAQSRSYQPGITETSSISRKQQTDAVVHPIPMRMLLSPREIRTHVLRLADSLSCFRSHLFLANSLKCRCGSCP
jgi:hypothetical protein